MRIEVTHEGCKPTRANQDDAGWDLRASEPDLLLVGDRKLVDVGIRVAIPPGQAGFIKPRSGLAVKSGIDTMAGVIDAGYRGPVKVLLINHGKQTFAFEQGDRIAQLVVMHIDTADAVFVDSLEETDRGQGGFGSSGVS